MTTQEACDIVKKGLPNYQLHLFDDLDEINEYLEASMKLRKVVMNASKCGLIRWIKEKE